MAAPRKRVRWTAEEIELLHGCAGRGMAHACRTLGQRHTVGAIQAKASDLHIHLAYNHKGRRKRAKSPCHYDLHPTEVCRAQSERTDRGGVAGPGRGRNVDYLSVRPFCKYDSTPFLYETCLIPSQHGCN